MFAFVRRKKLPQGSGGVSSVAPLVRPITGGPPPPSPPRGIRAVRVAPDDRRARSRRGNRLLFLCPCRRQTLFPPCCLLPRPLPYFPPRSLPPARGKLNSLQPSTSSSLRQRTMTSASRTRTSVFEFSLLAPEVSRAAVCPPFPRPGRLSELRRSLSFPRPTSSKFR